MTEFTEVADGVFVLVYPKLRVNCTLIVGDTGALLVDTLSTVAQARELRAAVERVTDRPLLVVNTHHHFDHCFGNATFTSPPFAAPVLHHDETIAFLAAGFEEIRSTSLTFSYLMQKPAHYLPASVNVEEDVAPIKTFIQDTNCIIMKRHGFTVLGRNVSECYGRTNVLAGEIKRNILAEQLAAQHGRKPEYLEAKEIESMFKHGDAVMYPKVKQ